MPRLVVCLASVLVFLSFVGCSSGPAIKEIPPTSSVSDEINHLEQDRNEAFHREINVLSPKNFSEVDKFLNAAKEARTDGKNSKVILKDISEARAYLKQAYEKAKVTQAALDPLLKSRDAAIAAEASKYRADEFESAEKELQDMTSSSEEGDTAKATDRSPTLQARYRDLEMESIKEKHLGPARSVVNKAIDEGAKDLAPKTLAWANQLMTEADAFVTANFHDSRALAKKETEMLAAADRLLTLTREAAATRDKTPEDLAAELEQERNQISALDKKAEEERLQLEQRVGEKESEVEKKDAELSEDKTAITALEGEKKLNDRFETARSKFSKNEAEVYKDGDKLLIRLKGLSFPAGQAEIQSSNYALLGKLKDVIKDFGNSRVTIEGHTDDLGSKDLNEKLSADRARAVERYIVANEVVPESKVSSVGYGDEKPLATNKTRAGRAQNRRVDVIVEPETQNP